VLKNLHKNNDIVILKSDERNGVVVLNKADYIKCINDIINDKHKFKELSNDPTISREGKLQRYLRELGKKGKSDKGTQFYLSIRFASSTYLWFA